MVKEIGGKSVSVTLKEMGVNCWLPKRFIEGERCQRVMECTYPEKKTCKSVNTEIAYLHQERREAEDRCTTKISKLLAERNG